MSVCRGCGGTGLDHTLSAREVQVAEAELLLRDDAGEGVRARHLNICRASDLEAGKRFGGSFAAPLAPLIAEIERLEGEGFALVLGAWPERAWACSWCHGTGEPNLSVATLNQRLQTGGTNG